MVYTHKYSHIMKVWKEVHKNISSISNQNGANIDTSYFIWYAFVTLWKYTNEFVLLLKIIMKKEINIIQLN